MARASQQFITAIHEAGHLVVAMCFDLKVFPVTTAPDAEGPRPAPFSLDYETISGPCRARRKAARGAIIAAYAGLEAQMLVDPRPDPAVVEHDELEAWGLSREYEVFPPGCGHVGSDVHERYMDGLRTRASRLVRRKRLVIEALARELERRKSMSGDEVAAYLNAEFPGVLPI